jgi:hypothetical protein
LLDTGTDSWFGTETHKTRGKKIRHKEKRITIEAMRCQIWCDFGRWSVGAGSDVEFGTPNTRDVYWWGLLGHGLGLMTFAYPTYPASCFFSIPGSGSSKPVWFLLCEMQSGRRMWMGLSGL